MVLFPHWWHGREFQLIDTGRRRNSARSLDTSNFHLYRQLSHRTEAQMMQCPHRAMESSIELFGVGSVSFSNSCKGSKAKPSVIVGLDPSTYPWLGTMICSYKFTAQDALILESRGANFKLGCRVESPGRLNVKIQISSQNN